MNKKIFAISVIILALDQISKSVIETLIKLEESIPVIKNFFSLTFIRNEGAAWGMFANRSLVLIFMSIIALLIIFKYMYMFQKNKRNTLAFGLLFGGITGNLVDRLLFGYVRDFLDFNVFGYDFPIFNIGDMAIVIGVLLLIIAILKGEDKNVRNKSNG